MKDEKTFVAEAIRESCVFCTSPASKSWCRGAHYERFSCAEHVPKLLRLIALDHGGRSEDYTLEEYPAVARPAAEALPATLPAGVRLLVPLTLTGSHYSYPDGHQFKALVWPDCVDWASLRRMREPAPLEPPTPKTLLAERLVERLSALPLRIELPSDYDLAREALERAVNWYFDSYSSGNDNGHRVLSAYHLHIVRKMDRDEAEAICGPNIIHTRALLNLLGRIATTVLDLDYDESFKEDELFAAVVKLKKQAASKT